MREILIAMLNDVRYGLRGMRRSPGFTVIALFTLALATGAVSTVFNLAYTFYWRKPPVEDPDRVVAVSATRRQGRVPGFVSYAGYAHFRDQSRSLQNLAAHYSGAPLFVSLGDRAQEINGAVVTANFFPMLGLKPASGRFFRPDEDAVPDRDPVAVLGYGLWRDWYHSSSDALGSSLKINGTTFTVIGVAPEAFRGTFHYPVEVYIPSMMLHVGYRFCDVLADPNCTILRMLGRLDHGRTLEEARAEMSRLLPPHWVHGEEGGNSGVSVELWQGTEHGESDTLLLRLLGLVSGVLMLVCCANLAALLNARGSIRVHEFAVRASLGAARSRLLRQLLSEAALLALLGGILGTVTSLAMTRAVGWMFYSVDAEGRVLYYDFSLQPGVMLAVLAVSVGAGFLFGLLPALHWSMTSPGESLKERGRSVSSRSTAGRWLIGAQTASAVALTAVAALLVASAYTALTGTNFEPSGVALMRLRPRLLNYPAERAQRFLRETIGRLESLPGVESVSLTGTGGVLGGGEAEVRLPGEQQRQGLTSQYSEIGPRFFETLRVPLMQGREFEESDVGNSPPVAIVNETLARSLWPSGQALGSEILLENGPHRVVGLVQDLILQSRSQERRPHLYVPFWQNPGQIDARLSLRVRGDPAAMLPLLAREVNRLDPDVPITEAMTLPLQLAGMFRPLRISAAFVAYAAALAVLLSAVGLCGALALAVSRRRKEIGLRIAVGARPAEILRMIVGEGMRVIGLGVVAGIGLAWAGTRIVRHLLLGTASADLLFFAAAGLMVAFTGLLACLLPARRASNVDPLIALKEE